MVFVLSIAADAKMQAHALEAQLREVEHHERGLMLHQLWLRCSSRDRCSVGSSCFVHHFFYFWLKFQWEPWERKVSFTFTFMTNKISLKKLDFIYYLPIF